MIAARLPRILLAYIAACLVASIIFVAEVPDAMFPVFVGRVGDSSWHVTDYLQLVPQAVAYVFVTIVVLTLVPSVIAITLTERTRIRSLRSYLLIGTFIGLVVIAVSGLLVARVLSHLPNDMLTFSPGSFLLSSLLKIIQGLCAAATYWAIAGRSAGRATVDVEL